MKNPPPSYQNIDKFVTRIHEESGQANRNRHWTRKQRALEREELVILKLVGFTFTEADALYKDFIVEVSHISPCLRLDADSVRSPLCQRRQKKNGGSGLVYQTLTLMDYERLHKDEWFNDRVIDFWRVWLQHGPTYDREDIDFYDSLQFEKNRLKNPMFDSVTMKLNPFAKKIVLIILNYEGAHWTVVVLLNLDAIRMKMVAKDLASPMPCMLLLDSLKTDTSGRKEHEHIVAWLRRKEPLLEVSKETIPLFLPPVLTQDDQNSCGPLSILNAYCMIRLHKQAFTYEYAGVNLRGKPLKGRGEPFEDMVKNSLEFAYSLHDVDRILGEMRCIVNELSTKQREAAKQPQTA